MIIKGFQPTTLIDYPKHVACIIFVAGCSFHCGFCYNKKLVEDSPELEEINEKEFFEFLDKRKVLIEGVVITGGEPTIYPDLPEFISKIKKKGFLVKLDTNGTNPDMIKELLDKKLIDYIAMDIKNSPEKYEKTVNRKTDINRIRKSIELIKNSKIDYEFRTTTLPKLITKDDFLKIGQWLKGAKKYYLQQFKATEDLIDERLRNEKPYSEKELQEIKRLLEPYFEKVEIR